MSRSEDDRSTYFEEKNAIADIEDFEPPNWREQLENIKKMRKQNAAPVDTMGCHKCHDEEASLKVQRFQKLVALMLSSQTKDTTTFAVMAELKHKGLTVENIVAIDEKELAEAIKKVSFYRTKAKSIKRVALILHTDYNDDIPRSLDELLKLPGVGSKMAILAMKSAWNEVVGISVDTHVHRIANLLGWTRKKTKQPEHTRKALESWIPKENWNEINHLLVGFGQTICDAKNPKCADCLNKYICPSAFPIKESAKRKKSESQNTKQNTKKQM